MSNTIDTWRRDHANFSRLLNLLERQVQLFLEAEAPNYDLMLDILYYMTHYPDLFHHPKEDLVTARARELEPGVGGAVDELMRQHVVLRESGAELLEQLQGIMDGVMLKRESVAAPATTYIAYFRSHMEKEEAEIFPLVQALLSEEDWAVIDKVAPSREDPLFGSGSIEQRYAGLHQQIVREANTAGTT